VASKIAVIGAGVFGAWTAYELRKQGHDVTLVDAWGPGNARSSSGGESRIIRAGYGSDELYSRMVVRSFDSWHELFRRTNRPLFKKTGVLWLEMPGEVYATRTREILRDLKVPFEELSNEQVKQRYPQISCPSGSGALYEPESGALMARQAVAVVVDEFVSLGGRFVIASAKPSRIPKHLEACEVSTGETIRADIFLFACGPWLPKLFPEVIGGRIVPTRQEVLFFGTPSGDPRYSSPGLPIWIDFTKVRGVYGFPDLESRGFKIAFDQHGPTFDPDTGERVVSPEKIIAARAYLSERFPALADMPVLESRVCQYENTSNGDFLIDRYPETDNVWLVGGGSGHGFKHGPAVGEYAAAQVTGAATTPEPRFSLASKSTMQRRTVY
jgi:sarcosine oxidase